MLSEVGSKDDTRIMAPYRWVEQIQQELEAGAWKVIAEARESGTAGIFRHDGEVRMGLIDEIVHAVPPTRSCSRRRARISRCGSCAGSAPTSTSATSRRTTCLSLETIRLGLRSDTASSVYE